MIELWKPIYGYENFYEVSNFGNVRSFPKVVRSGRGKTIKKSVALKPQRRQHGYLAVWLYANGTRKQVSVHRLVAEAFCEKKDGCNEVNHIDEDKTNNHADNLEWCTRQENATHGSRTARIAEKNTNGKRSKPVEQYTLSGEFVKRYPSMHEARRQTGFAEGNIYRAINGMYSHAYGYKWRYA